MYFEENKKALSAMYFTGMGGEELGNILSFLGLPNSDNLKKYSGRTLDEFTECVIKIVSKEIDSAMEEEIEATILQDKGEEFLNEWKYGNISDSYKVGLTVSYDTGWLEKLSGRRYDSKSSHTFLVGANTQKIIGCVVFSKNCKQCEYNLKRYFPICP